jgi:uncharacterized membrane protein
MKLLVSHTTAKETLNNRWETKIHRNKKQRNTKSKNKTNKDIKSLGKHYNKDIQQRQEINTKQRLVVLTNRLYRLDHKIRRQDVLPKLEGFKLNRATSGWIQIPTSLRILNLTE